MSTLNKLPDGSNAPEYKCVAYCEVLDETKTVTLIEWWYEGKKVQPIEQSAKEYFYEAFDKSPFKIKSVEEVE